MLLKSAVSGGVYRVCKMLRDKVRENNIALTESILANLREDACGNMEFINLINTWEREEHSHPS
jgi:hypothetical protein